jgi:hypothetical protein
MAPVNYDDIYTDGATDLTAGATWGNNNLVLLANQTQTISTNLNVATNTPDVVHVIGGGPRIDGWTVKLDATYTSNPNFVWAAGGYSSVTFDTNACTEAIIENGTHVIAGGTVTTLVVNGGQVTIGASATVGTLILGGGTVNALSAIATVRQNGGRLNAKKVRIGATSYHLLGGTGYIDNTSGSACTVLHLGTAGILHPQAGDVATINRDGGTIVYSSAEQDLTLGSTAFTNYGGPTPNTTGMVTVSNLTDYSGYSTGSAHGIPGGHG